MKDGLLERAYNPMFKYW